MYYKSHGFAGSDISDLLRAPRIIMAQGTMIIDYQIIEVFLC